MYITLPCIIHKWPWDQLGVCVHSFSSYVWWIHVETNTVQVSVWPRGCPGTQRLLRTVSGMEALVFCPTSRRRDGTSPLVQKVIVYVSQGFSVPQQCLQIQSTGDCFGFSLKGFVSLYKNYELIYSSLFLPSSLSWLSVFLFLTTSFFILSIWDLI